MMSFSKLNKKY